MCVCGCVCVINLYDVITYLNQSIINKATISINNKHTKGKHKNCRSTKTVNIVVVKLHKRVRISRVTNTFLSQFSKQTNYSYVLWSLTVGQRCYLYTLNCLLLYCTHRQCIVVALLHTHRHTIFIWTPLMESSRLLTHMDSGQRLLCVRLLCLQSSKMRCVCVCVCVCAVPVAKNGVI